MKQNVEKPPITDISKFTPEDRMTYEQRMKYRRVFEATQEFARNTGITIGSLRQAQKIAKAMLVEGDSIEKIGNYIPSAATPILEGARRF
jgi:hypothetical protein